jgi:pyrroloquinoline-quinone synthase
MLLSGKSPNHRFGRLVNSKVFVQELEDRIARYNLLRHPFYQAWFSGTLSFDHLRAFATEYFHHVAAFPTFLSALHSRLEDSALRRAVLRNLAEEEVEGRAHSDLWLDFAEGIGLSPEKVRRSQPSAGVRRLIKRFRRSALQDSPSEVLAALYAYESQVPRLSGEEACGLLRHYGADARTCGYFALHTYADVRQSQVWREELGRAVAADSNLAEPALDAAERAALWLWQGLEESDAHRLNGRICGRATSAA